MEPQTWAAWAAVIASVITILVTVLIAKHSHASQETTSIETRLGMLETLIAAINVKVETMWMFQIRRGVSEAIVQGIATKNSPLKFDEAALKRLEPLKEELVSFVHELPPDTSDPEAMLMIENKFGSKIVDTVCIPTGLSHASCLLLAYSVAKQLNPIDLAI